MAEIWRDDRAFLGQPPDAVIAVLSRDHVVARDVLLGGGLTPSMIRTRLERGSLHPYLRGVYAVGQPVPGERGRRRGALLAAGWRDEPAKRWTAGLGHLSAGASWMLGVEEARKVDVVVLRSGRRIDGVALHRASRLDRRDLVVRDGLPTTSLPRTLIDLCDVLDASVVRRCVDRAVTLHGLTRSALADALRRHPGRRAHAVLGPLLAVDGELTRSELERLYLSVLRAHGAPEPQVNVRLGRVTPDCAWPEFRLLVEIDSYQWHSSRARQHADAMRDAHHAAAGRRVLRFVTGQLRTEPRLVVAATLRALRDGGWTG